MQETVTADECRNADERKVLESGEHVELQPEEEVETKDGRKAHVEAQSPQRDLDIAEVDADAEPLKPIDVLDMYAISYQNKEEKSWQ